MVMSVGDLQELGLLPPRSQESNSDCQACLQMPSYTEPSCQPPLSILFLSTYYVPGIGQGMGHAVGTQSLPMWADWGHVVQWLGMWTPGPESLNLFLLSAGISCVTSSQLLHLAELSL